MKRNTNTGKTKLSYFLIIILMTSISLSCTSIKTSLLKTNNQGGYKIGSTSNEQYKLTEKTILVYGKVYDIKTNKPMAGAKIKVGCREYNTNLTGDYSFKLKKSNKFYLSSNFIGYKNIETILFEDYNKSTLQIDFFLEEDNRPLFNCEGNN